MLEHFKKNIFILFFYWVNLAFAQTSIIEYPNWFLHPSKFPTITTGYNSSDSTALKNAAKRKTVLESSIAKGSLYLYEVHDDFDFNKYSDYYYYYSSKRAKEIENTMISVDRFIINVLNDEYIEAFKSDTTKTDSINYIDINEIPIPDWVNGKSFFEKNGYYYSIGIYTSTGRDNDAWITSEEQAMFNLLRNLYIQINGITKVIDSENNSEDSYERVSSHKLNTKMSNIEVMERYPDRKAQLYFTLIRVKEGDVKIIKR